MRIARGMKQRLMELLVLAYILAVGAAIVVASGIVPVKASSGHWPITTWILSFASGRSIATNSASIVVPPLDEPGMVRLGAATFESNCAWCHGSPLEQQPAVAAAMTPAPPTLSKTIGRWEPNELFYIVQHGIKFTGMPAWPTLARDDEIWPVVAFLRSLEQMTASKYRDLLNLGDRKSNLSQITQGLATIENCTTCHHLDGTSLAGPRVPHLSGQSIEYLKSALTAFKSGDRPSGVMEPIVSRLSNSELEQFAKHFSEQRTPAAAANNSQSEFNTGELQEGLRLILEGDKQAKIASCVSCHGPPDSSHSEYPELAGQNAMYIEEQLQLFADRIRQGGEWEIMHEIAEHLTPKQRHAVALAYEAMPNNALLDGEK